MTFLSTKQQFYSLDPEKVNAERDKIIILEIGPNLEDS